jgi:hypothetical protein
MNDWSHGVVDTKSWGNTNMNTNNNNANMNKESDNMLQMNKNDDWNEGRIDTSSWGINLPPVIKLIIFFELFFFSLFLS